jgi:CheY-like chemotaxis protein
LTVARRLTHLLGGDVSVDGDPTSGGAVTLTIPVQLPANVRMVQQPGEAVLLREKELNGAKPLLKLDCHILLAEDGPENQRLISFILKCAGAEVTVVDNGKQAVDRILAECHNAQPGGNGPFDAVLMDIDMPLLSGDKIVSIIRGNEFSTLPVVYFSGKPSSELAAFAAKTQPAAHVQKDQGLQALADKIRSYTTA